MGELELLLNENKADGLRIYYGCHYESTNPDPKLDYIGLHNIIFVATKDSVDPENPTTETSVDQLRDWPDAKGGSEGGPPDYFENAGEYTSLCPPTCPVTPQ